MARTVGFEKNLYISSIHNEEIQILGQVLVMSVSELLADAESYLTTRYCKTKITPICWVIFMWPEWSSTILSLTNHLLSCLLSTITQNVLIVPLHKPRESHYVPETSVSC